jgi:hypothetical protein
MEKKKKCGRKLMKNGRRTKIDFWIFYSYAITPHLFLYLIFSMGLKQKFHTHNPFFQF